MFWSFPETSCEQAVCTRHDVECTCTQLPVVLDSESLHHDRPAGMNILGHVIIPSNATTALMIPIITFVMAVMLHVCNTMFGRTSVTAVVLSSVSTGPRGTELH